MYASHDSSGVVAVLFLFFLDIRIAVCQFLALSYKKRETGSAGEQILTIQNVTVISRTVVEL
jgi:hypothetical protein